MGESGLGVLATAKQVTVDDSLKWEAEVKAFELKATADTIEEAFAEITPMIEKHIKREFDARKIISAELVAITAKAEFIIRTPDNHTLDTFSKE